MKIFDLTTDNVQFMKKLIDSMKEISVEINFELSDESIIISKMNSVSSICCFMELKNNDKIQFTCTHKKKNPLVVGINLLILSKIFKSLSMDNIINMYIDSSNSNLLCLKLLNKKKKEITNYYISFIELNEEKITIPETNFDVSLVLDSKYFHKTIKDVSNLDSKAVELKFCNNQLFFSSIGGYIYRETIIEEDKENVNSLVKILNKKADVFISQGKYGLKDIMSICKFCSLAKNVNIRLKNDTPLYLGFDLQEYGEIKILITSNK